MNYVRIYYSLDIVLQYSHEAFTLNFKRNKLISKEMLQKGHKVEQKICCTAFYGMWQRMQKWKKLS